MLLRPNQVNRNLVNSHPNLNQAINHSLHSNNKTQMHLGIKIVIMLTKTMKIITEGKVVVLEVTRSEKIGKL